jgi:uncharacterized protein DUF1629
MTDFWSAAESLAVLHQLGRLSDDCGDQEPSFRPQPCKILNLEEVQSAGNRAGRERDTPFPVAQLKITLEDFDADYFVYDFLYRFVSERLRDAMDLDSAGARFFKVDASSSPPLARSKNYQIMEIAAVEDVVDLEGSIYLTKSRLPGMDGGDLFYFNHIAFRPDAAPRHELFYVRQAYITLCTEALALRVLKAGCTGMSFTHPNRGPDGQVFRRTLRGVEEYVEWDAVNGVEVTKLVTGIN